MRRNFSRSFNSLADILGFTNEFFGATVIEPSIRYVVDLAIDELFTNMVKYNANSSADIGVSFAQTDTVITVTLIDYESGYFDITKARAVDINVPAEERAIGGLGLHLVHQMVDSLQYDYDAGVSTIVFTKNKEVENA
jgi:serine/threonine-protein kinase RsbW